MSRADCDFCDEVAAKTVEKYAELARLRAANQIMQEALEWYADPENWNRIHKSKDEYGHTWESDASLNEWKRARTALKRVEELTHDR